jgi:hypothetical protein
VIKINPPKSKTIVESGAKIGYETIWRNLIKVRQEDDLRS